MGSLCAGGDRLLANNTDEGSEGAPAAAYSAHACAIGTASLARFALADTEHLIRSWLCGGRQPPTALRPLFWLTVYLCAPLVLIGMAIHAPFGQTTVAFDIDTGTGRSAETESEAALRGLEHEIRVDWIYLTDAIYVFQLLTALVQTLAAVLGAEPRYRASQVLLGDMFVPAFLLAGNVGFLGSILREHQWATRWFIFFNGGVAAMEVVDLSYALYRLQAENALATHLGATLGASSDVLFMIWATVQYARLWNAYGKRRRSHKQELVRSASGPQRTLEGALATVESIAQRGVDDHRRYILCCGERWPACMLAAMLASGVGMVALQIVFVALDVDYLDDIEHASGADPE